MTDDPKTRPAGEGLTDEEMLAQVAGQTSNDLKAVDVFEREHDGSVTDRAAAVADGDDLLSAPGS